jgi:hypothetical protein
MMNNDGNVIPFDEAEKPQNIEPAASIKERPSCSRCMHGAWVGARHPAHFQSSSGGFRHACPRAQRTTKTLD